MFDWFINIIKLTAAKSYTPNQGPQRVVPRHNYESLSPVDQKKIIGPQYNPGNTNPEYTIASKIQRMVSDAYLQASTEDSPIPGKTVLEVAADVLNKLKQTGSKLAVPVKYDILKKSERLDVALDEQTLDTLILVNYISNVLDPHHINDYMDTVKSDPETAYNKLITVIPKLINKAPYKNTSLLNLQTAVNEEENEQNDVVSLTKYEDGSNTDGERSGRGIADENEPNKGLPEEQVNNAETEKDDQSTTEPKENSSNNYTNTERNQDARNIQSRIRRIYNKIRRNPRIKDPNLVYAFGELLKQMGALSASNDSGFNAANTSVLLFLPESVKALVEGVLPMGTEKGMDAKKVLQDAINNTKVSTPSISPNPVTISDLRDMHKAAVDTKNLLSPYFSSKKRNAVTDLEDFKRRVRDIERNLEEYKKKGKDEKFLETYKASTKYDTLKSIVSKLDLPGLNQENTDDVLSAIYASKESLENSVKKLNDTLNRSEKRAADEATKDAYSKLLVNKNQAVKALQNSNIPYSDKVKYKKMLNVQYGYIISDLFSEKFKTLSKRMKTDGNSTAYISESDVSDSIADLLNQMILNKKIEMLTAVPEASTYDEYVRAARRTAIDIPGNVHIYEEGTPEPEKITNISQALYALYKNPNRAYEISEMFPENIVNLFLHFLLFIMDPDKKNEVEREVGEEETVAYLDKKQVAEELKDAGVLKELDIDPDSEEGLTEQYNDLLVKKRLLEESISSREQQLEKTGNKSAKSRIEEIIKNKKALLNQVNARIKEIGNRLLALNKNHFAERDIEKLDEVDVSKLKTVFPNKKAYEYSGTWYEAVKNPITNKYMVTDNAIPDPVIVDPMVYKDEGEYYVSGKNSENYYKLNQETGKISDVPVHDILGEEVSTYSDWFNSGSKSRINKAAPEKAAFKINERILKKLQNDPERAKEVLLRVYEHPEKETSSYIKNSLFETFESDPDILLDFSKRVNKNNMSPDEIARMDEASETVLGRPEHENEKQPEKTEDIVTPTESEEVLTEKSGFMFGMRRTAAFFKFAASDDNYTEMNSKQEDKEQKLIEAPGVEDFQYNAENSENSKTEDVELTEEFSMEKLGKVLRIIKSESPEKWEEIVDIVRQSSAKSGDELAVFLQLFANNNWNGEAALRAYNKEAVSPRNRSYFWSMFKRNVWPQLQSNPSVVNVVKALNKNVAVDEEDVDTNEYKNV